MDQRRADYLAGDRPDDVAIYLSDDAVDDPGRLTDHGEPVPGGTIIVVDGERGRSVFQSLAGVAPAGFAGTAREQEGRIDADLTGGTCPDADGDDEGHAVRFLFSFAEPQKDDMEGRYGEGDVVHAYAQCECGVAYSQWWHVGDRDEE